MPVTFAQRVKKKKKRVRGGKRTPAEENSLSVSNQSVPPSVSYAHLSLQVQVGEKPTKFRLLIYMEKAREAENEMPTKREDAMKCAWKLDMLRKREKLTIKDDPSRG